MKCVNESDVALADPDGVFSVAIKAAVAVDHMSVCVCGKSKENYSSTQQ